MKLSSSWNAYRTASIVLMLYCALHSYGALLLHRLQECRHAEVVE
jgi:hypothetical protein